MTVGRSEHFGKVWGRGKDQPAFVFVAEVAKKPFFPQPVYGVEELKNIFRNVKWIWIAFDNTFGARVPFNSTRNTPLERLSGSTLFHTELGAVCFLASDTEYVEIFRYHLHGIGKFIKR
ncbi:hypothetical protein AVEN_118750-1 [Araneus ventricosus]|uniref:Uncharacterized protein n=1 Tax=Araneus ventricosus TaxID=182803 RepID=A0A4Y2BXJ7_ARAVE|nr:hypothetical protein AVEN_118750-1 [Araneus ventricosus]